MAANGPADIRVAASKAELIETGRKRMRTQKKINFARRWRETGNAAEAYRQVYNVRPNTKSATVRDSAWRLLQDPDVTQMVMELEDEAREQHLVTVEGLTNELETARDLAETTNQPAAMTSAIMGKAKLNGLGVDKKHVTHETSERMAEILGGQKD